MPAILYALGALLINLLRQYLPGIVGRVMLALGVGLVSYKVALPALEDFLVTQFGALPAGVFAYVGASGLDLCATMVLSTLVAVRAQRVILSKIGTGG